VTRHLIDVGVGAEKEVKRTGALEINPRVGMLPLQIL